MIRLLSILFGGLLFVVSVYLPNIRDHDANEYDTAGIGIAMRQDNRIDWIEVSLAGTYEKVYGLEIQNDSAQVLTSISSDRQMISVYQPNQQSSSITLVSTQPPHNLLTIHAPEKILSSVEWRPDYNELAYIVEDQRDNSAYLVRQNIQGDILWRYSLPSEDYIIRWIVEWQDADHILYMSTPSNDDASMILNIHTEEMSNPPQSQRWSIDADEVINYMSGDERWSHQSQILRDRNQTVLSIYKMDQEALANKEPRPYELYDTLIHDGLWLYSRTLWSRDGNTFLYSGISSSATTPRDRMPSFNLYNLQTKTDHFIADTSTFADIYPPVSLMHASPNGDFIMFQGSPDPAYESFYVMQVNGNSDPIEMYRYLKPRPNDYLLRMYYWLPPVDMNYSGTALIIGGLLLTSIGLVTVGLSLKS